MKFPPLAVFSRNTLSCTLRVGLILAGVGCRLSANVKEPALEAGLVNVSQRNLVSEELLKQSDLQSGTAGSGDLGPALKLYVEGNFVNAIASAEAVAAATPSTRAYEIIGASRIRLGEFEKGIEALTTAVRLSPESISPLVALGNAFLVREKLDEARKYFLLISERSPGHPEAHEGLGLVSEREGKFEEAIPHFEAAIAAKPGERLGVRVNLARLFNRQHKFEKSIALLSDRAMTEPVNESAVEMLAVAFMGAGRAMDAIRTYSVAYAASPSASMALGLGLSHRQAGQLGESARYFKQATLMRSNWDGAWIQLAETQIAMADFASALASLTRARVLMTEPLAIDSRIGEVHVLAKEYDKAVAVFERLASANPDNALISARLASAYQAKGDVRSAERVLRNAVERFPSDPLPAYRLGLLYDRTGRAADSIAAFEKARSVEPANVAVERALGTAYSKAGQSDRALEVAKQMVGRDPSAIEPKLFFAAISTHAGSDGPAAEMYRDVLKAEPDHAIALNNLAMILARNGEFEQATELARRAVSLLPKSGQVLDSLGWISYLQGDYSSAVTQLKQAAELSPQDPSILYHLGMACMKQDRRSEALEYFTRAITFSKDFPEYKEATKLISSLKS